MKISPRSARLLPLLCCLFLLAALHGPGSSHAAEPPPSATPPVEQEPVASARGQSLVVGGVSIVEDQLVVTFTTEGLPTVWTHLYLQTDGHVESGHRHWTDTEGRQGMDYLVEGDTLYSWSGRDDQRGWHWERVEGGAVNRSVHDNGVTIQIPLALLKTAPGAEIGVFVETMSENFQETLDLLPREGGALKAVAPATLPAARAAATPAKPAADARERFRKIGSYACYYGSGATQELSARDAVIIETRHQTPANLVALKEKGVVVVAYISAGEDTALRKGDGAGPGGYDSRYFDRDNNGQPDKNEIWNSYFTRASSESWRRFFLEEARRLRDSFGVDGFFLDTVETFTLYTENRQPMVDLIRDLRAEFPQAVIVLNRGWDLLPDLAGVVDGMMYESFTLSYDFGTKSYVRMRPSALDEGREIFERFINPVREKAGLVVLALDYAGGPDDPAIQDAADRAVTFGMIPEVSNIYLDKIYPRQFEGRRNAKWLKELLTPESMTYVLPGPLNGFPQGTRVVPSSLYADYSVSPVVDGVAEKAALGWRNRAWASRERPDPHWLEFRFPEPRPVAEVKVVWATDNGEAFPSRRFAVQVKPPGAQAEWKTVWSTEANRTKVSVASFPEAKAQGIRIAQEIEGGSSGRPNLMWIEQVELIR